MEIVIHKMYLPSPETGNPSENMPRVHDGSETQNRISDVKDPIPQEQVDSATVNTSLCSAHNGFTCKVCLKSFPSSLQLRIHSPIHNKPKQFEKGRESGQTSKKANSMVHLQMAQEFSSSRNKTTLKHQCDICLKTFCSPSKLQRHLLIHTGQKPYSCKICRKAFRQKVHLKSHLNTANRCSPVADTERIKQGFCNGRQTSDLQPQSSLEQQRRSSRRTPVNSSVELELQCKISVNAVQDLNKTEIKSDAVTKPQRPSNTGSQCQGICPKSDKEEQQYLKPFQCMICSRSFRLRVNLIRHWKVHRNQKEFGSATTVQNGDNVTTSDPEAIRHFPEPSHSDPVDLNIIVKPETWSVNCSDQVDDLPQYSEFITSAERWRETHRASGKWQRHQCRTCLKCFPSVSKLQRHTMTHTGQRPFVCEMCGKRFRQKTHLRVHCHSHLWSRYHKQRSLHIKSFCIGGSNTRTAADVPVQKMVLHKKDFEKHTGSDVNSVKHLDPTRSVLIIQNDDRESHNKLLPHTSRKNEMVPQRTVSKVTVKGTQTAQSRKNPGNVQHKCFQCLKCFPSASKLQRHEMVHTGVKPFQCLICGKAFRQAPHLKTHETTHCGRKPSKPVNQHHHISNVDGALSNGASELRCTSRQISTTKVNPLFKTISKSNITCKRRKLHTCQICFKNFDFPYKLSRHLVTHSGIRPYKCTLCSKTFTQRGHLKVHEHGCRQMCIYADTAEIPCRSKGVMANSESNKLLSDELVSSLAENQMQPENYWCEPLTVFECDKCTESFNSKNNLIQHICSTHFQAKMTASGQKYRCDICFKHFVSPSKLNRHYVTHTGQRPFSCDICGKTFTQSAHVRKHRQTH